MNGGIRGLLAGALTLTAIHTLVAYNGPSARLNQLVGGQGVIVRLAQRFLDPTVPAIPDRGARSSSSSSSGNPSGVPGGTSRPAYPAPAGPVAPTYGSTGQHV